MKNVKLEIIITILAALLAAAYIVSLPPAPPNSDQPKKVVWDNDTVIRETKKCENAGLKAELWYNGWTGTTNRINCVPRDER